VLLQIHVAFDLACTVPCSYCSTITLFRSCDDDSECLNLIRLQSYKRSLKISYSPSLFSKLNFLKIVGAWGHMIYVLPFILVVRWRSIEDMIYWVRVLVNSLCFTCKLSSEIRASVRKLLSWHTKVWNSFLVLPKAKCICPLWREGIFYRNPRSCMDTNKQWQACLGHQTTSA